MADFSLVEAQTIDTPIGTFQAATDTAYCWKLDHPSLGGLTIKYVRESEVPWELTFDGRTTYWLTHSRLRVKLATLYVPPQSQEDTAKVKKRPAVRSFWSMFDAQTLVRDLEPHLNEVGFTAAVGGSVLRKGVSINDLDLILFPLSRYELQVTGVTPLWEKLESLGWTLVVTADAVHAAWRKEGSLDNKHVEVWNTPDGKRVDVFLLQ